MNKTAYYTGYIEKDASMSSTFKKINPFVTRAASRRAITKSYPKRLTELTLMSNVPKMDEYTKASPLKKQILALLHSPKLKSGRYEALKMKRDFAAWAKRKYGLEEAAEKYNATGANNIAEALKLVKGKPGMPLAGLAPSLPGSPIPSVAPTLPNQMALHEALNSIRKLKPGKNGVIGGTTYKQSLQQRLQKQLMHNAGNV